MKKEHIKHNYSLLLSNAKPLYKFYLVLALLFAVISVGAKLYLPIIIGSYIDQIFKGLGFSSQNIIYMCLFIMISVIANYLFNILLAQYSEHLVKNLRDRAYAKINKCSIKYLDSTYHGDAISKVTSDCENISNGIKQSFSSIFEGIFTIIFTIVFMYLINPIMASIVVICTPLSILVSALYGKKSARYYKEKAHLMGQVSAYSFEMINNYDLIRSFNANSDMLANFKDVSSETQKADFKATFAGAWINPGTRVVNNVIYTIVMCAGTLLTFLGSGIGFAFSIGQLTSFLSYTNQYMKPFNEISSVYGDIQYALASLDRLDVLYKVEDEIDEGKEKLTTSINSLKVDNIVFGYTPNKIITNDLSFKIKKGEKLAIVGSTGSGKTTIINLLMRFYEVNSGEIIYNDILASNITKGSLRTHMGMVLQDTWIFNGSVLDNIKYGKEEASFEEVVEASKKVQADEFIRRLPDGYNTIINSNSGLSAGEMQLICIARMMLIKPDFIILDEATSNVDTRTERLISKAFDLLMKDKTSIVIAHRLSTIKSANKILVIDKGKVVESGTHSELIAQKGFYYSLYMAQFE